MLYPYLNKHEGETCTIIGNGPSLRDVSIEFLCHYPTFGTNRVYLKFIPTYYVVMNELVIQQNREEIERLSATKFVRAGSGLTGIPLRKSTRKPFSFDPLAWVNEGWTVTHVCLQLAFHMGFMTVLLVGVDHRYEFDGKPDTPELLDGADPNHFDPAYFAGQRWQPPDLKRSEQYYRAARRVYEEDGRRIVNLTEGSALDVFERGQIEEWM